MKSVSTTRIAIIGIVTFISIIFTYPTLRYYLYLRTQPEVHGAEPAKNSPEPQTGDIEGHVQWEKDNPEFVKWRNANPDYLAWLPKAEQLRGSAIPLGLDLIGGVDVTLKLDRVTAI